MIKLRQKREGEDFNVEAFDFTKMTAISTCPKWGIIRYSLHKSMATAKKELALDAGEACHQVFSAVRLLDLLYHGSAHYPDIDVALTVEKRFKRLFSADKWDEFRMLAYRNGDPSFDAIDAAMFILENSGYEEHHSDRMRTMSNLEQSCILYTQMYPFGKNIPLIKGDFVGVENAFDLVIEQETMELDVPITRLYRFTGKIDGVHCIGNDPNRIFIAEEKTGKITDTWEQSFRTSHQPTGYMLATKVLLGIMPEYCQIGGLSIPLPRSMLDGVKSFPIQRTGEDFYRWGTWVENAIATYEKYKDEPLEAPMFTHSCSRYFRMCSFIDLCSMNDEDQKMMLEEMSTKEWSPLHDEQS